MVKQDGTNWSWYTMVMVKMVFDMVQNGWYEMTKILHSNTQYLSKIYRLTKQEK